MIFNKLIFLGSDHGGFNLKEKIKLYLYSNNLLVHDVGTSSEDSVNYVEYASKVAREVLIHDSVGIICCSSGIGVSIVANKFMGVRAALCTSKFHAEFSRRHNDANIMCLGQKVTPENEAIEMVNIFLNTGFDGGRHLKRVNSILKIEENNFKVIREKI